MLAAPLLSDALGTAADRAVKALGDGSSSSGLRSLQRPSADTDSRTTLPPPLKSPTLGAGNKER
jgi:hypothetical protein